MQKNVPFIVFLVALISMLSCKNSTEESGSIEEQVEQKISEMTLQEKIDMIHASSSFTSGGVDRLGIPELVISDGPHGVRHEHGRDWAKDDNVYDSSTYLPVGTALASTWNTDLGYKFGQVLGAEARYRGKDVILGPGLNIIRDPRNGRNFEYMTEDPFLNSQFVVGYVKGVQENEVAACAKHYIANSLEFERTKVDVRMDERTLREIYLPGFKAAVKEAGVLTIMAAYNRLNGDWCAQNEYLNIDILKNEFGFEGLVMSDWNAINNTKEALEGGVDIEMGTDLKMLGDPEGPDYDKFYMADAANSMIIDGVVDESVVDEKVRRILTVMHGINAFSERGPGAYNTSEHQQIAREIANEAIILLRNDKDILPIDQTIGSLAVVGANATWKHAGAGGSSQVKAFYEVTPLEGLNNLLGSSVDIVHAQGYTISRDGGTTDEMIAEAVAAVKSTDAAIYVGGWVHGYTDDWNDNAYDAEEFDKPDMNLPFGQDELIRAVLKANPNTVIVLVGGGPVNMVSWGETATIVQAGYAGMEGGNALADILFGQLNPSGKLTYTWPKALEDSPAHVLSSYPDENLVIDHKEGIFVGYRYFDTYKVQPAFPFGHGLSYTEFEYSDLVINKTDDGVIAEVTVTNSGDREGAEIVQVYVKDVDSSVTKADKELKGFTKIKLAPSASQKVSIGLGLDAFKHYNVQQKGWVLESGTFSILVGSSSVDIRLTEDVQM